jgi:hypothetical protein
MCKRHPPAVQFSGGQLGTQKCGRKKSKGGVEEAANSHLKPGSDGKAEGQVE